MVTAWTTASLLLSIRYVESIPRKSLNLPTGLIKESFYHDFCLVDYDNQTSIKNCWMGSNTVSLPDLRTEDSFVLRMWQYWIRKLVSKYNIDGLRLDSAQQVDNTFFTPFQAAGKYHIPLTWYIMLTD